MWKPRSETPESEWKWSQAAGPVVDTGGGEAELQYRARDGSSATRPSRIWSDIRHTAGGEPSGVNKEEHTLLELDPSPVPCFG